MTTPFEPYTELLNRMREIALISSTAELLSWDQETYMPSKALDHRAGQMAHFSGWCHRLFIAPETGNWISACEDHGFAEGSAEAANIRIWRRDYDRQTKIPTDLVEAFQRTRTHGREAWVNARKQSDFALFQPHLAKLVELNRQMADHWGFTDSPYDALLEEYEPGARTKALRDLFRELGPTLTEIFNQGVEASRSIPEDLLLGDYPIEKQQALNREVAQAIGFDFNAGRIDTTTHPFCTSLGPGDCRLTTRYNEKDFTQSLYGILHEAGHGLYEQGLPSEWFGTPIGQANSLGIHESQSRLWENHVGRSRRFWEFWHPRVCRYFPNLKALSPEQITAAVNRVQPSFIRVESDQVSYDLHITLRFEIELKLIEGTLSINDLPGHWNERFRSLLGLDVQQDRDGCLQDVHWSLGMFGYFPTYTLGNLNAAQLMRSARQADAEIDSNLASGNYTHLLDWLRKQIHAPGRRVDPQDLMRAATGDSTQSNHHLDYLREAVLPVLS